METILEVKNLSKRFGSQLVVDSISFKIEKGKIYGLLGPNGSGKSTTLGIILGVVNKSEGDFLWYNGTKTAVEALKRIGALIERPNFYPYMTAVQNLKLVCNIKQISYDSIDRVLKIVDLLEQKNIKFHAFSLGMKQRLAIGSALLNYPEMLILDEPTNGLDPQGIHHIRKIIKDIAAQGTTVLLASHLLSEVEKTCTDILIIRKGKMLYQGRVSDLKKGNSYFELKSSNSLKLLKKLEKHPKLISLDTSSSLLYKGYFKDTVSAEELNKYLVEHEVYLSHLIEKKPNLEEYFLQLTNDK